jgi:hypothetical protein
MEMLVRTELGSFRDWIPEQQLEKLNSLLDVEASKGWNLISNVHLSQYSRELTVTLIKRKIPSQNLIRANVILYVLTFGVWLVVHHIYLAVRHPSKVLEVGSTGDAYCAR